MSFDHLSSARMDDMVTTLTKGRLEELRRNRESISQIAAKLRGANAWTILKHSIGKDLTRLCIPVLFNEPLTLLQRIAEYVEYVHLLRNASTENDPVQRIQVVASFAVSALSSTANRTRKPFNPILGETYQLDRYDSFKYRVCLEQVSHHPPISAFHVDGDGFQFYGSVQPKIKIRGQSLEVDPAGTMTLHLTELDEMYTWNNPKTLVTSIIVGSMRIEQEGSMVIVGHKSGLQCSLNFKPPTSLFGRNEKRSVEGYVTDKSNKRLKAIYGDWTAFLASCDVNLYNKVGGKWKKEPGLTRTSSTPSTSSTLAPLVNSTFQHCSAEGIAGSTVLWRLHEKAQGDPFFDLTTFAMQLNALDETTGPNLAPTDSRLRPDVKHLEQGNLEMAEQEKLRLENKQRHAEEERKRTKQPWKPKWFTEADHPIEGKRWQFNKAYWSNTDWTGCVDLF